jgi:hypothetical protein
MTTNSSEKSFEIVDFSNAIQRKTTQFMRLPNQVNLAVNASFARIGGVEKIAGYNQMGNTITTSSSTSTSTSTSTTSSSTTSSSTSTSTSSSSTTTGT